MNTTNVFVEILAIGIHTLTWIFLFFFAIVGIDKLKFDSIPSFLSLVPILLSAYILGILIDRLSDLYFRPTDHKFRKKLLETFETECSFLEIRFFILQKSSEIYKQLEYTRSRLRIARASVINFLMTTVASLFFVYAQLSNFFDKHTIHLLYSFITFTGFILTSISYYSFKILAQSYIANTLTAYNLLANDDQSNCNPVSKP